MDRNQRRRRPSDQQRGTRLSFTRYYRLIQIRGLLKLYKLSNKTKDKIGRMLNVALIVLIFTFCFMHFAHISCFYSIKTYIDTLDVGKIRENFAMADVAQSKPLLIVERDPLKGWWNNNIKSIYSTYFASSSEMESTNLNDKNDLFFNYLQLQSNEMDILEYQRLNQDKFQDGFSLSQQLLQQFIMEQEYFCLQKQYTKSKSPTSLDDEVKDKLHNKQSLSECLQIQKNSSQYFEITQDLVKDVYPNIISYGITQVGIMMSNEIFYTNFLYEILGPVKSKVTVYSILPMAESVYSEHHYKNYPIEFNLSVFPSPPDSMVKYMYQIKSAIMLKTLYTMLTIGGLSSFMVYYLKKFLYFWHQKPEKFIKLSNLIKMLGCLCIVYQYTKSLQLSVQQDSLFMKIRFMSAHIFVILVSNLLQPIYQYNSIIMIEFFLVNFLFLSYSLTYPCTYLVLLHLVYEIGVLSILYRFFMKRGSRALSEAVQEILNNEENFNDLVLVNQEMISRELNLPVNLLRPNANQSPLQSNNNSSNLQQDLTQERQRNGNIRRGVNNNGGSLRSRRQHQHQNGGKRVYRTAKITKRTQKVEQFVPQDMLVDEQFGIVTVNEPNQVQLENMESQFDASREEIKEKVSNQRVINTDINQEEENKSSMQEDNSDDYTDEDSSILEKEVSHEEQKEDDDQEDESDDDSSSQESDVDPDTQALQEFLLRNTLRMQGVDLEQANEQSDDEEEGSEEEEDDDDDDVSDDQQQDQEFTEKPQETAQNTQQIIENLQTEQIQVNDNNDENSTINNQIDFLVDSDDDKEDYQIQDTNL
eukprot:403357780